MTILAAHFGITLGIWRLRVRIDLDEPRESKLREQPAPERAGAESAGAAPAPAYVTPPRGATWGRG
jgi:DNA-binding protein H-NS